MFPDEMRERILNSGLAYISSWAPQIDILNHEVRTTWGILLEILIRFNSHF